MNECERLGQPLSQVFLIVSIQTQRLYLFRNSELIGDYPVSTSVKEPSCHENSYGTPWGMHIIKEKIGAGQPAGMVFEGRKPVEKHYKDHRPLPGRESMITSRILRIKGLESAINRGPGVDSFGRYVYIHGTNFEDKVGQPASAGCINLKNTDVIELFEATPEGSFVWIARR